MAELLSARAARAPEAPAFRFLIDGGEEGPRLSYADLDRGARAVAAALQDVAGPGDRALLLFSPGLSFLPAFFGCQYAGVVPVPLPPPSRADRSAAGWQSLAAIAADCEPRAILTDRTVARFLPGGGIPALAGVPGIVTDDLDPGGGRRWRPPAGDPDGLALLQYTSGSTASPKGVMVTHRNLLHNQATIRAAFGHAGDTVGVCWLPAYHDMGLIGGLLQTVYLGASTALMSPAAVLRDPSRWLRAVSRYRAHTSGGPNFVYDFCARRVTPEQKAGLDLSNWGVAAVGSEPIDPRTLDRFARAFRSCGFRPEAFYPCYGLAEATLLVTGGAKDAAPVVRAGITRPDGGEPRPLPEEIERPLVGCGHAQGGQTVWIVDPESRARLPDGRVGEIWVRGPSVANGYWNRPAETEETFRARLASGDGPYLRTGDLGFIREGELFVTGRIKEVIIVRGRNHYPQDIEATIQAVHPGLRPGYGAAFEVVRDGQPRLVVVQEVDRPCPKLDVARLNGVVRQTVAERHELQVYDLVLLEYGCISKTTSGKIRRHAYRAAYEEGTLRRWEDRTL